jgi:hypothetical protein
MSCIVLRLRAEALCRRLQDWMICPTHNVTTKCLLPSSSSSSSLFRFRPHLTDILSYILSFNFPTPKLSSGDRRMLSSSCALPPSVDHTSTMQRSSKIEALTQIDNRLVMPQAGPMHIEDVQKSCGEPLLPLRIRRFPAVYLKRWQKTGEVHRHWPDFKQNVLDSISLTEAGVFDEDDNIRRLPSLFCDIFRRRDTEPKFPGLIVCHHNRRTLKEAKKCIENNHWIQKHWLQPVCSP